MPIQTVKVNRAPVLTLWAAVVAERMGFEWGSALTLGKALAGLNAQSKGRSLGIYHAPELGPGAKPKAKTGLGEDRWVELCGRPIPVKSTQAGLRAVVLDDPIDPESVTRYLEGKFGEALPEVRKAMQTLARAHTQEELATEAFDLYQSFRPQVARGEQGWGQAGTLDLKKILALAKPQRP
ncbi:MAG: hypothetical protein NTY23_10745 [Chloroflexi bacterium]|nr:hypothetical protein [Chloroflexota bacterium]